MLSNTEAEFKKSVAYKKKRVIRMNFVGALIREIKFEEIFMNLR